jgi:hypothetical protein
VAVLRNAKIRFPNLRIAYLGSRSRASFRCDTARQPGRKCRSCCGVPICGRMVRRRENRTD